MTCAKGATTIDTSTDTNTKETKEPKPAKESKSVKFKPQAKTQGHQASKAKGITEVPYVLRIFAFN
jgi:hypothetical protein